METFASRAMSCIVGLPPPPRRLALVFVALSSLIAAVVPSLSLSRNPARKRPLKHILKSISYLHIMPPDRQGCRRLERGEHNASSNHTHDRRRASRALCRERTCADGAD